MALRKSTGIADPSAPNPYTGYYVELVDKTPFKPIGGRLFCVWHYRISSQALATSTGAPPIGVLRSRVGLVFSSRIDIKQPELYPECEPAQSTSLLRPPNDDKQYVFRTIPPGIAATTKTDIFFIAPCEEDSFTPIRVVDAMAEGGTWVDVPFRVLESDLCATHVIRGPAIVTSV